MVRVGHKFGTGIICVFLLFSACKHDIPVQPATDNPAIPGNDTPTISGQPCDPNTVYFQRDVLPILLSNCTMSGCHDAASHQKGVNLTSYSTVMATADVRPGNLNGSDLYEVITETDPKKRMPEAPRAPLTQAQISIIGKWIQQGAKNETCGTATCDSSNVTYSGTIQPIVQTNCLGCHLGGANASGGLDFGTHATLASVAANGRLVGAVSHASGYQPMPQGGRLNDCQIAQIKKWAKQGAPNN
jgi:uncharacterized membrane protein